MMVRSGDENISCIYKYRALVENSKPSVIKETTEAIWKNLEIFFSTADSLNDPFDCYFNLDANVTEDHISNYILSERCNDEMRSEYAAKICQVGMTNLVKNINDQRKTKDECQRVISRVRLVNRIFCLSEQFDNIPLWSHYADNHAGICIGFRTSMIQNSLCIAAGSEYAEELRGYPLIPVEYNDSPFLLYNHYIDYYGEQIKAILCTKSTQWAYERERRVIMSSKQTRDGLMPVTEDAIGEILFGVMTPKPMQDLVINSLKTHYKNFDKIEFFKMEKHPTDRVLIKTAL